MEIPEIDRLHDLNFSVERARRAAGIAHSVEETIARAVQSRAFDDGPFDYPAWLLQSANRIR